MLRCAKCIGLWTNAANFWKCWKTLRNVVLQKGFWCYLNVFDGFWMFLAFSIFSYLFMHVLALSHSFTMFQGGLCRSPAPGLCSVTCSVVLSPRNAEKAQQLRDEFPEVVRVANSSMTRSSNSGPNSLSWHVPSFCHIFSHGPLFFFWFGEPKLYIGLRTRMLLACVEWFSMMASWSLYEPIFLEHVITW